MLWEILQMIILLGALGASGVTFVGLRAYGLEKAEIEKWGYDVNDRIKALEARIEGCEIVAERRTAALAADIVLLQNARDLDGERIAGCTKAISALIRRVNELMLEVRNPLRVVEPEDVVRTSASVPSDPFVKPDNPAS